LVTLNEKVLAFGIRAWQNSFHHDTGHDQNQDVLAGEN
jgi:hypothetical protein